MKEILFTGSGVAIVTPFHAGAVNFPAFGRLIDRQIDGGTAAIIVCRTTGEAATMTQKERMETIAYCVDREMCIRDSAHPLPARGMQHP